MPATIRAFRPRDYEIVVSLRNAAHPTRPVSVKSFIDEDARQSDGLAPVWVRFVAEDRDRGLLGYGEAGRYLGMAPGRFTVFVTVARESRGQGIGSALLSQVEDWAYSKGAQHYLTAYVRGDNDGSFAWAQHRAYQLDLERSEAVLDLKSWNGAAFAGYLAGIRAGGLKLLVTEEPLAEGLLRGVYEVEAGASQDEPGFEGDTPAWEEWRSEFARSESRKLVALAMNEDHVVGISQVSLPQVPGASAHTNFTGVLRHYRGQGLALALKLLTIEAVQARGIAAMTATNDSSNHAMLAVNRKLGYEIKPGPRRLKKPL